MRTEQENIQAVQAKRTALKWLLGTIYLALLGMYLSQIEAFTEFNYRLHEVMFFPAFAAMTLVPIELLVFMYPPIKYRHTKRSILTAREKMGYESSWQDWNTFVTVDDKLQQEDSRYFADGQTTATS